MVHAERAHVDSRPPNVTHNRDGSAHEIEPPQTSPSFVRSARPVAPGPPLVPREVVQDCCLNRHPGREEKVDAHPLRQPNEDGQLNANAQQRNCTKGEPSLPFGSGSGRFAPVPDHLNRPPTLGRLPPAPGGIASRTHLLRVRSSGGVGRAAKRAQRSLTLRPPSL